MSELEFLPEQAAALGLSAPPTVQRLNFALADGRTVSALQFGDGPPEVTFLHGVGLNAHTWDVTILAAGVPALAIDLPGHGDSSWREDAAYSARPLAADIAPAIAAWTDRPQLLVGQSLGGSTAAALAATHPELVREVVIIDITPGINRSGSAAQLRAFFAGPTDWATRDEVIERALAFGLGGDRANAVRGVTLNTRIRPDGRVEWKHHFAHLAAALASDPDAANAYDQGQDALAAVISTTGWEDLAGVQAPIDFIFATRGYLTASDRDDFAARVPQARLFEVDSSHNVQEEQAPALGRWLGALVRGEHLPNETIRDTSETGAPAAL